MHNKDDDKIFLTHHLKYLSYLIHKDFARDYEKYYGNKRQQIFYSISIKFFIKHTKDILMIMVICKVYAMGMDT